MTAEMYRYDGVSEWVWHETLFDGVTKKGVVPDTDIPFEANIEPVNRGFKTKIGEKIQVVAPGQKPVEYWRTYHTGKKIHFTKFRLIPT